MYEINNFLTSSISFNNRRACQRAVQILKAKCCQWRMWRWLHDSSSSNQYIYRFHHSKYKAVPHIIHSSHVSPRHDNAIIAETVMNPQASMENMDKKVGRRLEGYVSQFYMNISCIRDKPQMLFSLLFTMIFRRDKSCVILKRLWQGNPPPSATLQYWCTLKTYFEFEKIIK
jgi:hypothetical protein